MRHLECFVRDRSDTSQIRLIALVLQNCFLTQLDPVLLFQLLDQCLQELLLCLHLLDLGLDFESDALFHTSLMHLISANLRKQLHVAHRSEKKTTLVELLAELLRALLLCDLSCVFLPVAEQFFNFLDRTPLVYPPVDDLLVSLPLQP